jgi:thymidylate synthase
MRQYLELLNDILTNGDGHDDRTGVGTCSVFGRQLKFDLEDGFPLMTTKRLSFKWIAEELFWFLSGSTQVKHLQQRGSHGKPITIWDAWCTPEKCAEFGRAPGQLGPVYGHTWRNFGASRQRSSEGAAESTYSENYRRYVNPGFNDDGDDQIDWLMYTLKENPCSRRLIVTGWHPTEARQVALPPCHTFFQFKWHEETNKLDCQLYQRSCDVFLGVPYNIASYALLTMIIAKCCGMKPGVFTHTFGDVHIYNNHRDQVAEQLSRKPMDLSKVTINSEMKNSGFKGLLNCRYEDLALTGYDPFPTIKAEVAV